MSKRLPALSASRAKDYLQCPLKFRFAVVDRIPQPPTQATFKGNVVHLVLERLFDLPLQERSLSNAQKLLPDAWADTLSAQPDAAVLFVSEDAQNPPPSEEEAFADCGVLLENYFHLERPDNLQPRGTEEFLDARLENGILLRGIVDRIDESPAGDLRVVDYKTGKSPNPRFMSDALFQMKFYALLLRESWRLPQRMQLLYLRDQQVLTLDPQQRDIDSFQLDIEDLWRQIESDAEAASFQPKTSKLCDWCSYKTICPAFGGTPPQIPSAGLERLLQVRSEPNQLAD